MIDCNHASQLLSRAQEEKLSFGQRFWLRLHLMGCDACSRFARQLDFMRDAMRRYRE